MLLLHLRSVFISKQINSMQKMRNTCVFIYYDGKAAFGVINNGEGTAQILDCKKVNIKYIINPCMPSV